ncbi:hypothetical protein K2173_004253 [Erythroxylum novogranatense]|uniref:Uncharacterized protein n=1 Tax=Erythroxylum novogranatense TaxID=1862640 RepID=A0AAV8TTI9_9ROSI|nr:hypothetical protein K2173_004253 [Erythroxylum novogranatense]
MKGTSKVIMGATLVMVVTLAIVLGLVLVLLAELYCTLLVRRRQLRFAPSSATASTNTTVPIATTITSPTIYDSNAQHAGPQNQSFSRHLSSYYCQGVLQAPRSFLYPSIPRKGNNQAAETRNKQCHPLHRVIQVLIQESNVIPQEIGIIKSSPPTTSLETSPRSELPARTRNEKACAVAGEQLVYISNPIYDNEASKPGMADTPFQTPDTFPSCLGYVSSSGEEEITKHSLPLTPPLTPMKKLPAEACSVPMRDARSLGTSGSDSVTNNGLSSSSSGTPCTSPSW